MSRRFNTSRVLESRPERRMIDVGKGCTRVDKSNEIYNRQVVTEEQNGGPNCR